MPESNECIVCGQPSETRVCMHCFFKYDHRTYNSRKLENRYDCDDGHLASFLQETFSVMENRSMNEMDVEHTANQQTSPKKLESGEDQSIISWFSRLSRFS